MSQSKEKCPKCKIFYSIGQDNKKYCNCGLFENIKGVDTRDVEMSKKHTNPKDAVGTKKVPFSVLPIPVLGEVGLAMLEGARKYGRHNYREAGVRASVYFDATFRHMGAFWEGEDIDSDSGLSHVTKAIAGLMVLRDSMIRENWVDDRPPKVKHGWVQDLNEKAKNIIEKHPDAIEPYTELNKKVEK